MVLCGMGPSYTKGTAEPLRDVRISNNSGSDVPFRVLHPVRDASGPKCIPPETPAAQQVRPQKTPTAHPALYVPLPGFWLSLSHDATGCCCDPSRTVANCRAVSKLSRSVAFGCHLSLIVSALQKFLERSVPKPLSHSLGI